MELENTQEVATQPTTVEARTFAPTSADADYANRLKQMDSLTASSSIASPDVSNMLKGFNVSNANRDAPNGPSGSGDNGHRDLVPAPGNGPDGGGVKGGAGGAEDSSSVGTTSPSSGPDVIHTTDGAVHPRPSQSETAERPVRIGSEKPLTARSVSEGPASLARDKPSNATTTSDLSAIKPANPTDGQPGRARPAVPGDAGRNRPFSSQLDKPNIPAHTPSRLDAPPAHGSDTSTGHAITRADAPHTDGRNARPGHETSRPTSHAPSERDRSAANVQQALDKLLEIIKRQRTRE